MSPSDTTAQVANKAATSKTKRRGRSQADIAANNFLKSAFEPVKRSLHLAWLCDVASVVLLMVQAWVLSLIFDRWLAAFIPSASLQWQETAVWMPTWLCVAVLALAMLLKVAVGYLRDVILTQAGMQVVTRVRADLLNRLGDMGVARRFFGSDGVIANKIIDEPEHLFGYVRFAVQKNTAVSTPILLAIFIAFFSPMAAMILLATAPLVPIFMVMIGTATSRKSREQMDAMAQLGGRFLDWIRGVNTLSRLSAVDIAVADIDNSAETYRKKTMSVLKIAFLNSAVLEFLSALSIALVAVYLGFGLIGILPWQPNVLITSYSTALLILLLVPEFYAPLRRLGAEYHVKGQAMAAAKAMMDMMNFQSVQAGKQQVDLVGAVGFRLTKVAAFGDDGRIRLSPTTLEFIAGKTTLLQGESGAGKSSLLQILLGFGQYTGDIEIYDEHQSYAYHQLDLAYLRHQFGYLAQTPALLPINIADNLRLAKQNATDAELITVLKAVGLWSLIDKLPDGLATQLSERGGGLSGGQAHRLAIAQLLLQDAKIWLLDEPTEHLDLATSQEICALLHRLATNKTVIWISHEQTTAAFDAVCRL